MELIFFLLFTFGVGYLLVPNAMMLLPTRRVLGVLLAFLFGSYITEPGFLHDVYMVGTLLSNMLFIAFGCMDCLLMRLAEAYIPVS